MATFLFSVDIAFFLEKKNQCLEMPIRAIWFRRNCASYQVGILVYGLVFFSSTLWIEAVL